MTIFRFASKGHCHSRHVESVRTDCPVRLAKNVHTLCLYLYGLVGRGPVVLTQLPTKIMFPYPYYLTVPKFDSQIGVVTSVVSKQKSVSIQVID